MSKPSSVHTPRRPLIVGCLVAAFLLVAVLGYEAVAAARAQRETAQGVLRDYAQLAAEQFARNVGITLDYGWFYPVVAQVGSVEPTAPFPGPDVEIEVQQETVRLGDLIIGFFRLDLDTGEGSIDPQYAGEHPVGRRALDVDRLDLLRDHVRSEYDEDSPYAAVLQRQGEKTRIFVYRLLGDDDGDTGSEAGNGTGGEVDGEVDGEAPRRLGSLVGFEADAARLPDFMEKALELYELLPESLTDGADTEGLVWVRLVDSAGNTLFENGPAAGQPLIAHAAVGPRFGALQVEAAIPPSAADRLVIGGVYGARLPLVVGTLAITVVVMLFGVGLLRREQELVDLREQFIAGASHELRTPLAQIRMFTETLLLERVRSSEERGRSLEILDREARRLAFLVENLLQFSRPRQPRSFVPAVTDLGRLVAEVVESFEPLAAARGTRIEVLACEGVEASVDRELLRQVLLNLLDNAVKYGPEAQTVTVALGGHEDRIALSVSDQGPGVRDSDRLRVWERFWRGGETNGVTGTGIGLALVKEVVVLHGGDIRVEDAPGGGARFVVRLPRSMT